MHEQDGAGPRLPAGLPRSATGRVPQWVIDEAAGPPPSPVPPEPPVPPVPPEPWRAGASAAQPPRRRRLRSRGPAAVVLVIGLALGAAHLAGPDPTMPGSATVQQALPYPTPGIGASAEPLGTPLPAPPAGGVHGFVALQEDGVTPVGYDPCRPVHYVVRPDNAPVGGEQVVRDAVARISEVTGLQFVYDGPTDEASSDARALYQPDRYGDRWAPVLISWQTEDENPVFGTDTVGEAGSAAVAITGEPKVYVTGVVDLDAGAFADFVARPGGVALARAVVLHELGHLVGLDHVSDPSQLMYPETHDAVDFGAGDLTGLARLGAGECVPQL
ncbi:matrixin family metalloprotease [Modestobacter lapidis]|nr:matrixin family metalloprotease [Modestobacter lapidis]